MTFSALGLRTELLRAVSDQGYEQPTPIQAKAIPQILAGRDILAGAQTGTGKTAGFTLPMLHQLSGVKPNKRSRAPRALVLAPTRELAGQVNDSVNTYSRHLRLRSSVIYGGVSMFPQVRRLRSGVDLIVATPGRLLDHCRQGTVDLSRIDFLVLDEADRMLDMGFIHDIKQIIDYLPPERQTLLFSATWTKAIKRLADDLLNDPVEIEVAKNATAANITQVIHPVDGNRKRDLLSNLITEGDWRQVLVFTRTKHGADRLAEQLDKSGIRSGAIHGNKTQNARNRALGDFKRGIFRVLVATDVAARGLDIDHLPHVVNYDLPDAPEDYLHRIGRTGRAGREGTAVSLVAHHERRQLAAIERLLKQDFERNVVSGFEPTRQERGDYGPSKKPKFDKNKKRPKWRAKNQEQGQEKRKIVLPNRERSEDGGSVVEGFRPKSVRPKTEDGSGVEGFRPKRPRAKVEGGSAVEGFRPKRARGEGEGGPQDGFRSKRRKKPGAGVSRKKNAKPSRTLRSNKKRPRKVGA